MIDFFASLHFSQPLWLYALPFTLALLAWGLWRRPDTLRSPASFFAGMAQYAYRHPQIDTLRTLGQGRAQQHRSRLWLGRFLIWAVLLLLLQVSLAQPYRLGRQLPQPQPYRDILFIVDTSVSMMLRDYLVAGKRVDRMHMLKDVLRHFVRALQGNRIGLITFSEQAYYFVPLTNDYALLEYQLQRLEPAVLTGRGSDVSRALLYSLRHVQPDSGQAQTDKPVLVLISGVHRPAREIDPRAAAAFLAAQGLRVHTIAIGAGSYAAEEEDSRTLIYHPASFALLEGIAQAGAGRFFWARDQASLNDALAVIKQAEQRTVDSEAQFIQQALYHWPLLAALLWLSLWQVLPLLRWRR